MRTALHETRGEVQATAPPGAHHARMPAGTDLHPSTPQRRRSFFDRDRYVLNIDIVQPEVNFQIT